MERAMDPAATQETPTVLPLAPAAVEELKRTFAEQGYAVLRGVVSKTLLAALQADIRDAHQRAVESGALFSGGGRLSGHLNCFPGEGSRRVYEELQAAGVIAAAKAMFPKAVGEPNVGCNLNLPGSVVQHIHVDSDYTAEFLIINIALVDTVIETAPSSWFRAPTAASTSTGATCSRVASGRRSDCR